MSKKREGEWPKETQRHSRKDAAKWRKYTVSVDNLQEAAPAGAGSSNRREVAIVVIITIPSIQLFY